MKYIEQLKMNTPNNQQPRSVALSSSKKTQLKGLKNILVQPHEILWPILKEEKEKIKLYNMLTELLPTKKCHTKEMSWMKLCRLSKEKRLILKKDAEAKLLEGNDNVMTSIILGINGVTKALEKNELCSILIDSNIEPLFMIKHIVIMGKNRSIPVLMVPFLKTITLNKIGFTCAALGIKRSVSEKKCEHFYELYVKITELVNMFENAKSPLQLFITEKEETMLQAKTTSESSSKKSTVDEICDPGLDTLVSKSVYKYRSSSKERVFIPSNLVPTAIEEKLWTEYIAFGNDENDKNTVVMDETPQLFPRARRHVDIHQLKDSLPEDKKTFPNDIESDAANSVKAESNNVHSGIVKNIQKFTYIPLKVKRIQGNPKRMKATKIAKIKKRGKVKK